MKRSRASIAFLGLILSFTACNRAPDGDKVSAGAEPAKPAEARSPLAAAPTKAKAKAPAGLAAPVRAARPAEAPVAAKGKDGDEESAHCDGKDAEERESDRVETIAVGTSPSRGPANAPVTVIVFSDFQCPFCSRAESTVRDLESAYPGKVRFVFKNNPLPFHEHARLAAKATLAANEQGKFWEYHDVLFSHQSDLGRAALERYAEDLGLDLRRFRAALDDSRLDALIEADIDEAHRLEVKGTPSFFVNGRFIQGAQPLATFRAKVDQALAER